MGVNRSLLKGLFIIAVLLVLVACSTDEVNEGGKEQKESGEIDSKTVSLATYPPGLAFNSAASGVATVVSENSPYQVNIRTFTSPDAWLPMLNEGEVDIGFTDSASQWHYKGTAMAVDEPMSNLRTLVMGNRIINVGFMAKVDSDIQSMKDLKGKRLGDYTKNEEQISVLLDIQLDSVGLSYDDVTPVPVSGVEQGVDLLRTDRVDAAFGGMPDAGLFLDLDSTSQVNAFSYGDYPVDEIDEVKEKYEEGIATKHPNMELVVAEGGLLKEPVIGLAYPTVLKSNTQFSDDAAYEIVKTLFENTEKLHPLFTWLEDWTPDTMFRPDPPTPYHDGAIKYFKEADLWTDEAEEYHQNLLDEVQ